MEAIPLGPKIHACEQRGRSHRTARRRKGGQAIKILETTAIYELPFLIPSQLGEQFSSNSVLMTTQDFNLASLLSVKENTKLIISMNRVA